MNVEISVSRHDPDPHISRHACSMIEFDLYRKYPTFSSVQYGLRDTLHSDGAMNDTTRPLSPSMERVIA